MINRALFLDRDGVINVNRGYVYKLEDVEFIDGVFNLVCAAKKAEYLIIIITNQAGIGRGFYGEEQFLHLMDWMKLKFLDNGGSIDAIYFCPYHPVYGIGKYCQESFFRKPNPGMLLQAQQEFNIDMKNSIMIGDNSWDIAAGLAAGVGNLYQYGSNEFDPVHSNCCSCINSFDAVLF